MMLFTGGIRLDENPRYSLAGPTNSTLMVTKWISIKQSFRFKNSIVFHFPQVTDVVPTDSGSYECRIMVRETVSITHTLLVSQSFSVQVNEICHQIFHRIFPTGFSSDGLSSVCVVFAKVTAATTRGLRRLHDRPAHQDWEGGVCWAGGELWAASTLARLSTDALVQASTVATVCTMEASYQLAVSEEDLEKCLYYCRLVLLS